MTLLGIQQHNQSDDELPTLDEIFRSRIITRELLGETLFPLIEKEFNKCMAEIIAYSRADAWRFEGGPLDTAEHRRARRAWVEWFMFAKCVMPTLPGGKAKEKRNGNIIANNAQRWARGEREALYGKRWCATQAQPESPRKGKER